MKNLKSYILIGTGALLLALGVFLPNGDPVLGRIMNPQAVGVAPAVADLNMAGYDVNNAGGVDIDGWELATSTVVCMAPDVCEFQADGVADNVTIQAAINAGSKVLIKEGTYVFEGTIDFPNTPYYLEGSGVGKTTFIASTTFSGFSLVYDFAGTSTNSVIEKITFSGNNVNGVGLIQIGYADNLTIRDNEFKDTYSSTGRWGVMIGTITNGLYTETASKNVMILGNRFYNIKPGTNETLLLVNNRDSVASGNYFENTTGSAYALNYYGNCINTQVSNNVFYGAGVGAVFMLDCANSSVTDNLIMASSTSHRGIDISNGSSILVDGNVIKLKNVAGISGGGIQQWDFTSYDGHTPVTAKTIDLKISNNTIDDAYTAISLANSASNLSTLDGFVVEGNVISDVVYHAMTIGRNVAGLDLDRGVVRNNTVLGGTYFDTATISLNGYTSNTALCSDVEISNNKITPSSNSARAGGIEVSACSGVEVSGNRMDDTAASSYTNDLRILNGTTFDSLSTFTDGMFGFGTSTPLSMLSVEGNMYLYGNATTTGSATFGGNVGIGTTSPATKLDVYNATATSSAYIYSGGAGLGGRLILEDVDGAGCTEVVALNGVLTAATVTCP